MKSSTQSTVEKFSQPKCIWLCKLGALAAVVIFVLLLIGMIGIITEALGFAVTSNWITPFYNNWLSVLFKLNIRMDGITPDSLTVLNPVDVLIMVLFSLLFLTLFAILSNTTKLWSAIATCLPILGIIVYLITKTAGRSGLLIGGLVYSIVMLRSKNFSRVSAYIGIIASGLLFFAGDIGTAAFHSSSIIAILIGAGYILWMLWVFLTGWRLYHLMILPG